MRFIKNKNNTFNLKSKIIFDTDKTIKKKIDNIDKSLISLQNLNKRHTKLKLFKSFLLEGEK